MLRHNLTSKLSFEFPLLTVVYIINFYPENDALCKLYELEVIGNKHCVTSPFSQLAEIMSQLLSPKNIMFITLLGTTVESLYLLRADFGTFMTRKDYQEDANICEATEP